MSSMSASTVGLLSQSKLLRDVPRHINLQLVPNLFFAYFFARWTRSLYWKLKGRGLIGTVLEAYKKTRSILYGYMLRIPSVRRKVQADLDTSLERMAEKLAPPTSTRNIRLPKCGMTSEAIQSELSELAGMDHTRWEDGQVSGAVYHGEDELLELQTHAYGMFTVANPIHPDVFPGVRKMEAEVVSMVLGLFNAPNGAAGVSTNGGTESILMACFGARQRAYAERGITEPEMIIPATAHTSFRKAADYFRIKLHLVDCPAPNYQVNVQTVSRLINRNTIMLAGSAPNFPHGIIDDIAGLSQLAKKYDLCLHIDCCLGSFVVACLEKAGFQAPVFDFRLEGVTSISCDTHKYGFAPKGNSTVLYRTKALRTYQYFVCPDWAGGVYASPGIAGSRAGALIAGCWASMMSLGEEGYIKTCIEIVGTAKSIIKAIKESETLNGDLRVIGNPLVSVVAFDSHTLNMYNIADRMSDKGWHLNALQDPPAIHIAVTLPTTKAWRVLIADLEGSVEDERRNNRLRILEGGDADTQPAGDAAALYGVAGSLPNKSVVTEVGYGFLDILYKV